MLIQDDEVARFLARRWFVEHGDSIIPGQLHTSLADMLPQQLLGGASARSRDHWTQAVIAAFNKMGLASNKYSNTEVCLCVFPGWNCRGLPVHVYSRSFLSENRF